MGSKPGWHYVTQSIIGLLVDYLNFRIDSEIEEKGYFVEIRTCKSRVVAEVRSQTRRRQVKSLSRFRRGNFARVFAALKQ